MCGNGIKRKKTVVTLEQKLEALKRFDKGESMQRLLTFYFGRATVIFRSRLVLLFLVRTLCVIVRAQPLHFVPCRFRFQSAPLCTFRGVSGW